MNAPARKTGAGWRRIALAGLWLSSLPAFAQQYRGFWVDAFNRGFKTPAQVDQLVKDVASAKCNAIFAEIRRRGDSYYLKSLEPPAEDPTYSPAFDALANLIEKAHAQGIEVHAWFPVNQLWTSPNPPQNPAHAFNQHGPTAINDDMWMSINSAGKISGSVDPAHPAVFQYLLNVILEPARNYNLDGLHLDYIRYNEDGIHGYNPTALDRFNRLYGRIDVPRGLDPEFSQFRRDQITALVRQIYLRAYAIRRSIKISAAVITWGNGPRSDDEFKSSDAYSRVFQDWRGWLEEGILDVAVPMNYFRERQFPGYLDRWLEFEKDRQYGRMTVVGLGSYLNSVSESVAQWTRALEPSQNGNRAAGLVFYSYASPSTLPDSSSLFSAAAGMFSDGNQIPELAWKSKPSRGQVSGTVSVSGGPAWLNDGVTIWIESDTGGSYVKKTITDSTGFFGAVDLPPDRYRARVEKDGREICRTSPRDVDAGMVTDFSISISESDLSDVGRALVSFPQNRSLR